MGDWDYSQWRLQLARLHQTWICTKNASFLEEYDVEGKVNWASAIEQTAVTARETSGRSRVVRVRSGHRSLPGKKDIAMNSTNVGQVGRQHCDRTLETANPCVN